MSSPASRGWNPLVCLHQAAPQPSLPVGSGCAEARFRPPPDASVSRRCDHLRCGVACLSRVGRHAGTDQYGCRHSRRCAHRQERPASIGRLATSISIWPARRYEDVNDADRLCRDPAMRWVVGDPAITGSAASTSQMGRFETEWLTRPENLAALDDLPGRCIDKVHARRPPS